MRTIRTTVAAALTAAAGAAAVLLPAAPAAAEPAARAPAESAAPAPADYPYPPTIPPLPYISTIVHDPARLVAHGTAVLVAVEVRCNTGRIANVGVDLEQTVDGVLLIGGGGTNILCTAGPQTVVITARPPAGSAYRTGPATAFAMGYTCGEVECAFSPDGYREIRIRR